MSPSLWCVSAGLAVFVDSFRSGLWLRPCGCSGRTWPRLISHRVFVQLVSGAVNCGLCVSSGIRFFIYVLKKRRRNRQA